ncbi:very short patch repair endonuclease [Acetobacteraceae bacterium KSS8]|uniref:Very short patch repair endonuclease n=2 Tax=Endosaccharibacter trunci TaxID=2812733 RepID=A0ABT1W3H4_9PROT|nr:very short patch repair endonuclease [Acetobacteraceae bacterium KSS8]
MSRVPQKGSSPEIRVRQAAHALGLRFRLHRRDLPGTPDIVFPRHGIVIFVHGCFWHRHPGCPKASMPKSRIEFWKAKFSRNIARDLRNKAHLEQMGWHVEVIWECETRNSLTLADRLSSLFSLLQRQPKHIERV